MKLTRAARLIGYSCFAFVSYYVVFLLPYRFPPQRRLLSASYIFGFNNLVAILGVLALLGVATLLHWRTQSHSPVQDGGLFHRTNGEANPRISSSSYWLMAFLYLLATLLIYMKVRPAPFYQIDWESSHFLWRLKLMEISHLRPYHDFQVIWGPAFVYPPVFVHRLLGPWGVSYEGSYYVCHYIMNLVSLYCLFYLVNRSAMPLTRKRISFFILACASFAPYMALSQVTVRFLFPYLSLVVIDTVLLRADYRVSRITLGRPFIVAFVAILLNVLLSPEVGLAFGIALAAYSLRLGHKHPPAGLSLILALLLAILLSYALLPSEYYAPLLRVSSGANNLPLLPAAHILLYLATLFIVIPPLLTAASRRPDTQVPLLIAFVTLCLLSIRGALGRCDPPHVFFYGLGASLFAFILLSRTTRRRFGAYAFAYTFVFVILWQWSNLRVFYGARPADVGQLIHNVFSGRILQPIEEPGLKHRGSQQPAYRGYLADPGKLDKYPPLGLPFGNYGIDKETENYLWQKRKIAPEYFVGGIGIYTEADLRNKIRGVSRNEYLLLRKNSENPGEGDTCAAQRRYLRLAFIYPVTLPCRRKGLDPDGEVAKYIANAYDIVEENGSYVVLRRSRQP